MNPPFSFRRQTAAKIVSLFSMKKTGCKKPVSFCLLLSDYT